MGNERTIPGTNDRRAKKGTDLRGSRPTVSSTLTVSKPIGRGQATSPAERRKRTEVVRRRANPPPQTSLRATDKTKHTHTERRTMHKVCTPQY